MSEQPPPSKRIRLSKEDLRHIAKEDLVSRWLEQETYLNTLEDLLRGSDRLGLAEELTDLRNSEAQLKTQLQDVKKRENVLILKLAAKEQEANECRSHIQMLKTSSTPSVTQLKSLLLDPAVNLMFQRMKTEVKEAKKKEKEAHDDLQAWQFTPDSQTGKRLMARCRSLLQENESIGKMIASGRVAKIEGELALQRRLVDEMKSGQAELDVFIAELDEDVEGMQSTIYLLQQQLREARTQMAQLQTENELLKTSEGASKRDFGGDDDDDKNHFNKVDIEGLRPQSRGSKETLTNAVQDPDDGGREESYEPGGQRKTMTSEKTIAVDAPPPLDENSPQQQQQQQQPSSNGDVDHEARDNDDVAVDRSTRDLEDAKDAAAAAKDPPASQASREETLFTLTVKDSERQELEEGFEEETTGVNDGNDDDVEMKSVEEDSKHSVSTAKDAGKSNGNGAGGGGGGGGGGSGGKSKYQRDVNNIFNNNGASAKRPYSPADDEVEKSNSKADKMNGSDSSAAAAAAAATNSGGRSSRSSHAASSPSKRSRGASGGGGRASRARRGGDVSADDVDDDDDRDAVDDHHGPVATAKGRSPRTGSSRSTAGARGTRGNSLVTNGGDAAPAPIENGMDCD